MAMLLGDTTKNLILIYIYIYIYTKVFFFGSFNFIYYAVISLCFYLETLATRVSVSYARIYMYVYIHIDSYDCYVLLFFIFL